MPDLMSGRNATFHKGGSPLTADCIGWNFRVGGNSTKYASDKTSGHKVEYITVDDFEADVTVKVPTTGTMELGRGMTFTAKFQGDDSGNNYIEAPVIVLSHPVPGDINEGQTNEVVFTLGPRGPATFFGVYAGPTSGT